MKHWLILPSSLGKNAIVDFDFHNECRLYTTILHVQMMLPLTVTVVRLEGTLVLFKCKAMAPKMHNLVL